MPGCKRHPKPYTAAGYTFTLAGSFEGNLEHQEKLDMVQFDAFSEDVTCMFQKLSVAVDPKEYEDELLHGLEGTGPQPIQLETKLGVFEGEAFDGKLKAGGVTGALGKLAGTPHVEIYALAKDKQLLALEVIRFGDEADGKSSRERCLKLLGSIRPAEAPGH